MKKIWGVVIGVHVALLVTMRISQNHPTILSNKKPLLIRTVMPATSRPQSVAVAQKKSTAKVASEATSSVSQKTVPAIVAPVQKALPPKTATTVAVNQPAKKVSTAPPLQKKGPAIPQKLLEELEASLSKIEAKPNKFSGKKSANMPNSGYSLQIDRLDNLDSKETEYQLELACYLQEVLHLPEYGEVKMEITVRPDGSVASLKVLETESAKNKSYLEKSLPLLRFPTYDKNSHTLILRFCNET